MRLRRPSELTSYGVIHLSSRELLGMKMSYSEVSRFVIERSGGRVFVVPGDGDSYRLFSHGCGQTAIFNPMGQGGDDLRRLAEQVTVLLRATSV